LIGADTQLLRKTIKESWGRSENYIDAWQWFSVRDPQAIDLATAGTLYINPEFDIINVECINPFIPSTSRTQRDDRVFFFFNQLKRLDPRGIGIANLAGDDWCMKFIAGSGRMGSHPGEVRQSRREIFQNLRGVYFVSPDQEGRSYKGLIGPLPEPGNGWDWP